MTVDYDAIWKEMREHLHSIPEYYNMGHDLSTKHCESGDGNKIAVYWEDSEGAVEKYTYHELNDLSNRFGGKHLARHGLVDDVLAGVGEACGAVNHAPRGIGLDPQIGVTPAHHVFVAPRRADLVRRLQVPGQEIEHPHHVAAGLGGEQQAGVADLTHGPGQAFAGLADDVGERHASVLEGKCRVVGAVE